MTDRTPDANAGRTSTLDDYVKKISERTLTTQITGTEADRIRDQRGLVARERDAVPEGLSRTAILTHTP